MIILAVDTSTTAGSVSVLDNKEILGEVFLNIKDTHSQRILKIIDFLLKSLKIDISDVELFVSSIGPGSFTGIRIGLSLLKGFSLVSNKPLIGISSLDALSMEFKGDGEFYSFIEGRKDEIFYAKYKKYNLKVERISDYINNNRDITKEFNNSIGIFKDNQYFKTSLKGNLFAHNFGILGFEKYTDAIDKSQFNAKNTLPLYLKKSDAEMDTSK